MFSEQFAFSFPAGVNFVGGGGKTGLILELLKEYAELVPVIYTTTTRMHPPHPADGLVVISSDNERYLERILEKAVMDQCRGRMYVITHLPISRNLLAGVSPTFGLRLNRLLFPLILNEGDGARSMSLKMPRASEPVLLAGCNYMVPVIGLDCLNRPLGPETIFRWEIATRCMNLQPGERVTPELAAAMLLHPEGVCKGWKPGMKIIPFINKADVAADDRLALSLAQALLRSRSFPVRRVVLGSLQRSRASCIVAE